MRKRKRADRSWVDDLPPPEIRALEESATTAPGTDALPDAISYCDRAPGDYVLTGPLGPSSSGRSFPDLATAQTALEEHYGARLRWVKSRTFQDGAPYWLALIRPLSQSSP